MVEVCNLPVEKYDGSLKAERGTRKEAFGLMKQIKHLFDPAILLNPRVILNNDLRSLSNNLSFFRWQMR